MGIRRTILEFLALVLNQDIIFREDQLREILSEEEKMRKSGFRFAREVWQDGTIHWYIEQYFTSRRQLENLFPEECANRRRLGYMTGGRYSESVSTWKRHKTDYPSMEEAILDLNNNIRKSEVMEITYLSTSAT